MKKFYLFKYCPNQIFWSCISDNEVSSVIKFCYFEAYKGHFSTKKDYCKILTMQILLTHHFQGHTFILQNLWKLSEVRIHFKTSYDAL